MHFSLVTLIFFSFFAHASIFDTDDRVDTKFASTEARTLARSVPALIQKHKIRELPDGRFELKGLLLSEYGICSDEAFADEKIIANCSASLIGKDKILTAAHCFEGKDYGCDTYSIVFDYELERSKAPVFEKSHVYHCKKILFLEFDKRLKGIDLAVIQLDREVSDREPVEVKLEQTLQLNNPLTLIGYPMGISQKVVETGKVIGIDKKNVSFKHDLDSFSVNSGSPIFSRGKQTGVMVRGTGPNFTERPGRSCIGWHVDSGNGYSEANDLSPLKAFFSGL